MSAPRQFRKVGVGFHTGAGPRSWPNFDANDFDCEVLMFSTTHFSFAQQIADVEIGDALPDA